MATLYCFMYLSTCGLVLNSYMLSTLVYPALFSKSVYDSTGVAAEYGKAKVLFGAE